MKAEISENGNLIITAETDAEVQPLMDFIYRFEDGESDLQYMLPVDSPTARELAGEFTH